MSSSDTPKWNKLRVQVHNLLGADVIDEADEQNPGHRIIGFQLNDVRIVSSPIHPTNKADALLNVVRDFAQSATTETQEVPDTASVVS